MELYRPYVDLQTIGGVAVQATGDMALDDNCNPPIEPGQTTATHAQGATGAAADNMLMADITVANNEWQYVSEHFIATMNRDIGAVNAQGITAFDWDNDNLKLTNASARLVPDVRAANVALDATSNYQIVLDGITESTHDLMYANATLKNALPQHLQNLVYEPAIACCKFQEWNKRTFMRTSEGIKKEYDRVCQVT